MWVEILPHVETVHLTNIVEHSKVGMIFESGVVEGYEPDVPRDLEGPFGTDGIKAWYEVLRKAKFDYYSGSQVVNTNETDQWYSKGWSEEGDEGTVTNSIYHGTWGGKTVTGSRSLYNGVNFVYEDGDLVDITPKQTEVELGGNIEDRFCSTETYDISIPLHYDLVHTGGVSRVSQATLFAFVGVSWDQNWRVMGADYNGYDISENGWSNRTYVVAVRQQGNVQELPGGVDVVKVTTSPTIQVTTNRFVAFRCTINMENLLEQAASLCGHPFPSYGFSPSPKFPCPPVYIDKWNPYPVDWSWSDGHSDTTETFGAFMESAILVIEFKPWTSLSGW